MSNLIGKTISIRVKKGYEKSTERWKIHSLHKKFMILENGMYRTSAFYDDIKRRISVVVY